MVSHRQIWAAVDELAARYNFSPSGLARAAGLNATTFNRSKRFTGEGRERWPSMESIAKILYATGADFEEFSALIAQLGKNDNFSLEKDIKYTQPIPLIGFAQAGTGGFFDDGGFPVGGGWDEISFPEVRDENAYALEVTGESMAPLYRQGDIIIVSPGAEVRRGDRVVIKTLEGEVMAKILEHHSNKVLTLSSFNEDHKSMQFALKDIEWVARIIWASQ